ncbi:hypothetical protein FE557_19325, partial [Clostridioides difficile]|uniref:hypothetical protein n=1 Tax=Clostridioides difficile TaxID=1496 RepID=UPI001A9B26E2
IDDFYKISDIYLESFMVGSHTSKLDAILYDLIPVKFKNEVSPIFTNMWNFIEIIYICCCSKTYNSIICNIT